MSNSEQYDVNFFKPLSAHAKANKKLILILAIIWAVGVFGFQFLLIIFNEPTPEKSFETFQKSWPTAIEQGADNQVKTDFAKSLLMVLGKNIAVKDNHKVILKESLTWTVASMLPDSVRPAFMKAPDKGTFELAAKTLRLQYSGFDKIMTDLLPFSIVKLEDDKFPEKCRKELPDIMGLYLVHNQNFLTDFTFIGFPFHYWYTAQFLLIMFVLLCVYYAVSIEKANKKHDFVEET